MSCPRVAMVTGGLAGIGLATARQLLADGCRVAVGSRSVQTGDAGGAAAAIEATGLQGSPEKLLVLPLDVRDEKSVDVFLNSVTEHWGGVDILVNSAGISTHQLVSGHDVKAWRDVIDTNLTGPFLTTRACLPGMIDRKWGRIVNVASTAAHTAVADHAAYCASKAGLLGLSRAVSLEGAPHGVTCVTVSPTWVETEMLRQSAQTMAKSSGLTMEAQMAELATSNPQSRLVQPEEIASLISYLASDAAAGLTMEDIRVSAGAHW